MNSLQPDMLLQYSLHEPRRGREDIKAFMADFRKRSPILTFGAPRTCLRKAITSSADGKAAEPIPGRRSAISSSDRCRPNTGRKMKFTGTTVLKLRDGRILEEIGLDDGVPALQQLGLIRAA